MDPEAAMRAIGRAVGARTPMFVDIGNAMIWALREIKRDVPRNCIVGRAQKWLKQCPT